MDLFYLNFLKLHLIRYVDVSYLSYPLKGILETRYLFTYNDTTVAWKVVK